MGFVRLVGPNTCTHQIRVVPNTCTHLVRVVLLGERRALGLTLARPEFLEATPSTLAS